MAPLTATNSLADALSKIQHPDNDRGNRGGDPLIDRLATALAVMPAPEPPDSDDLDEDLDLPMLVQGGRPNAIIPLPPVRQRAREGRAALVGFMLGLVLLVPIGVVMSNRLPEAAAVKADFAAIPATLIATPVQELAAETVIRTTKRPVQTVALSEPVEAQALPAPAAATVAASIAAPPMALAALPAPPAVAPLPAPAPVIVAAPPPPDHLAEAIAFIGKGDISAARMKIEAAEPESNPQAALALAETYDPNMLAAWGIRGAHANVERARLLYVQALMSGMTKARQRLDALE